MSEGKKITVICDGIGCDSEITIPIPEGWSSRIGDIEYENGRSLYCPKCKGQFGFFNNVCPGCVEGFPECALGRMFLLRGKLQITDNVLSVIESGLCPGRTNGTMIGYGNVLAPIDISDRATVENGKAVANAIRKYVEKYKDLY